MTTAPPAPDLERIPSGGLLSVPGVRGAAVACGLKESGALDLALLTGRAPWTAAGVFTRNALPAAPVTESRAVLAAGDEVRVIVINAGNANAMTGEEGRRHARAMAERAAGHCGGPALVLSTGVIGVPLPVDRVLDGIDAAAGCLGEEHGDAIADAILTTDTVRKACAVRVRLPAGGGRPACVATVGGVAKGSGMIHPDMATMLAVVATDVPVEAETLRAMLRRGTDRSFHEITVDGDTSTNDAVLLLAERGSGAVTAPDPRAASLETAITTVMEDLAGRIVHDGEGASRVLHLRVTGAASVEEARLVAGSIVRSSLVKTALAGADPNWGRILAAAANAGVPLTAERLSLRIGGSYVYRRGAPVCHDAAGVAAAMRAGDVDVELELGRGESSARRLTTDLTAEYVRINAEYTT